MKFYSYLWLREDGSAYYAGKGTGRRAYQRAGHHVRPPKDESRIVVFPMMNEAEAFESEIALIELFGRKDLGTGCLRNRSDGGEGVSNPSQKTREKHIPYGRVTGLIYGRKNVESGHLASISSLGGRAAVQSGQLASICSAGGRKRAMYTNHARWHVQRNRIEATCSLCQG